MKKSSTTKPRVPRGKRDKSAKDHEPNQTAADQFEQEGMGVAAKE
jgi:hypothetical protein